MYLSQSRSINLYFAILKRLLCLRYFVFVALIINAPYISYADQEADDFTPDEFGVLVRRLIYNPDDLGVGDKLRQHCRKNSIVDKCIDALNTLTEKHPKNKSLRYQAALAYVDHVPGHSLFRQGWLSTRSMDHMSKVLELDPEDWTAYYIRGLNGLYWPTSFRKLPKSIKDLKVCIALSGKMPIGLLQPYHVLAYIALGDAYAKKGEIEMARKTYLGAADLFESNKINRRLEMDSDELSAFIKNLRRTDTRVDTEISFLLDGGKSKI